MRYTPEVDFPLWLQTATEEELEEVIEKIHPGPNHLRNIEAKLQLKKLQRQHEQGLQNKLTSIDNRLIAVEGAAKKPETSTWAFRLAIVGIILALLALVVSWRAWKHPVEPEGKSPASALPASRALAPKTPAQSPVTQPPAPADKKGP